MSHPPVSSTDAPPSPWRGRHVLLVDDNAVFAETLRLALEHAGVVTTVVASGAAALAQLRRTAFDAVLLDILMPDQDGIETLLQLRQAHPAAAVIAMSGGGRIAREDALLLARRLGAVAALAKPFALDELLHAIGRVAA